MAEEEVPAVFQDGSKVYLTHERLKNLEGFIGERYGLQTVTTEKGTHFLEIIRDMGYRVSADKSFWFESGEHVLLKRGDEVLEGKMFLLGGRFAVETRLGSRYLWVIEDMGYQVLKRE